MSVCNVDKMVRVRWFSVTEMYPDRATHKQQIDGADQTGLVVALRQGKTFPIWCYQSAALPSTHFLPKQNKRPGSLKSCSLWIYQIAAFSCSYIFCERKHSSFGVNTVWLMNAAIKIIFAHIREEVNSCFYRLLLLFHTVVSVTH